MVQIIVFISKEYVLNDFVYLPEFTNNYLGNLSLCCSILTSYLVHTFLRPPPSLACVGFTELTVMNQVPKAFTLFSFRTKDNISVKRQSWRPHYPDSWLTVLPRNELYLCSLFYNPSSQVTTCFPDLSDVSEQEVFHASCCQRLKKEPAFSFEGAKPT